jgi:transglutaminase-like putative cysteine protease
MNRRRFLTSAAIGTAALALPRGSRLLAQSASPSTDTGWRTFEVVTRVEVLQPSGATRIWLPTPLASDTPFQKTPSNDFTAEGGQARISREKRNSLGILDAEFPAGAKPVVTLTSRVATRNYSVDTTAASSAANAKESNLEYFLRPTKLIPTDGIVKTTALEITKGASSDVERARAIYEWIVDNTSRNPKTRGCGLGDIRFMLETKDLSGKCADLNALYVGLARASGLPARDVYGIRLAKSELGYKSLGASSEKITKSQHCRAEVYLNKIGWTPVDPADVRKVILEEPPGNRALTDELVTKARARLFGSWEMNWMAYNFAHDVTLPGSRGPQLGFLMYPQAETDAGRIDCLDPDAFRYEITSRELTTS